MTKRLGRVGAAVVVLLWAVGAGAGTASAADAVTFGQPSATSVFGESIEFNQPAVFAEMFPPAVRYSGASHTLTLGTIIGGAIAPIVATYLFSLTGTSTLITVYMTAVSVVSFVCSLGLRETFRDSLSQD